MAPVRSRDLLTKAEYWGTKAEHNHKLTEFVPSGGVAVYTIDPSTPTTFFAKGSENHFRKPPGPQTILQGRSAPGTILESKQRLDGG